MTGLELGGYLGFIPQGPPEELAFAQAHLARVDSLPHLENAASERRLDPPGC